MYHWFDGMFAKKQGCLGNSEPWKGDLSYPKTKIVAEFLIKTIEEMQEYAQVYSSQTAKFFTSYSALFKR